jgi:uridine kinase
MLTSAFSAIMIGLHLLISDGVTLPLLGLNPSVFLGNIGALVTPHIHSLWITLLVAVGLVLLAQMLRERVRRNDSFRIAQQPVTIGIAGDSGSGKDTLSRALAGMFGEHSVVHVSGDDYHLWDRFAPMWQGLTHLNPRANDLRRFNNDVLSLIDGKRIICRQYDHAAGRFLPPTMLEKNDVIIASGLHTLTAQQLRERLDVSIYLDMDTELRRAWKIQRDVNERGHSLQDVEASLLRREADAQRFIVPQEAFAGIVLGLRPVNPAQLPVASTGKPVRLKLAVRLRRSINYERLTRALIAVCGMHVDVDFDDKTGEVDMTIEGDVAADDIGLAATMLVPELQEILDRNPDWQDGMTGIMQLLVLTQVEESLRSRLR